METQSPPLTFDHFGIDPRCLRVIHSMKITEPSPVQAQAIPIAIEGKDVVAVAQTGTGKTLGFALPSLTRLAQGKPGRNAMLVLVPTRELCVQVQTVLRDLGKAMDIRTVAVYGGVSLENQAKELRQGVAIIVATPGRLLDHMSRGNIRFEHLRILVLDEGDRMLDMGFLPDIQMILRKLPVDRQTLMFSATFPPEIARLAERMMRDPERITVGAIAKPVDTVRQRLYAVQPEDKTALLLKLLEEQDVTSALVFLRTKSRTDRLGTALKKQGHKASAIHGDRSQSQRQQALDSFRAGKIKILVATDVAARGLDIDGVSHVFNYDIPMAADDYIHRIGRTARAKASGDAVTFVSPAEYKALESIEKTLGHNIPREDWDRAPLVLSLFHPPSERTGPQRSAARHRRRPPARRRR